LSSQVAICQAVMSSGPGL